MTKSAKTRNAAITKRTILQTAELLFAEHGFAGTSINMIAEKSGISGPLILFHFKDKKGIYAAVKASIIRRYAANRPVKPECENSIEHFVDNMINSMFAFYRDNPSMVKLASWSHLEGEIDPWPGEDELHHIYEDYLQTAQTDGKIRSDISPFNISAMICGAIHIWWEFHAHFMKHADPQGGNTAAIDKQYLEQLRGFIIRGLSPEEGSPAKTQTVP